MSCKVKSIEQKYRDVAPNIANDLQDNYSQTLDLVKQSGLVTFVDGKFVTNKPNELQAYLSTYNKTVDIKDGVVYTNPLQSTMLEGGMLESEALKYAKSILPSLKNNELLFVTSLALNAKFHTDATGAYKNGLVYIASNNGVVGKSVIRHEVFHKIWNEYLSPAEKDSLFNYYNKDFKAKNLFEFEEMLAEKYQDYVSTKKHKSSVIKTIFNKILRFFGLITANTESISKFFDQVDSGVFSIQKDVADNTPRFMKKVVEKMGSVQRYEFGLELVKSFATEAFGKGFATSFVIDGKNKFLNIPSSDITNFRLYSKAVLNHIKTNPAFIQNSKLIGSVFDNPKFADFRELVLKDAKAGETNTVSQKDSLLDAVQKHFDELFADAFGIKPEKLNLTKEELEELENNLIEKDEEETGNLSQEIKDKTNIDGFENSSQRIKVFLSTINVLDNVLDKELDDESKVKYMNAKRVYAALVTAMQYTNKLAKNESFGTQLEKSIQNGRQGSDKKTLDAVLKKLAAIEKSIADRNKSNSSPLYFFNANEALIVNSIYTDTELSKKQKLTNKLYHFDFGMYDNLEIVDVSNDKLKDGQFVVKAYHIATNKIYYALCDGKVSKEPSEFNKAFVERVHKLLVEKKTPLVQKEKSLIESIVSDLTGTVNNDLYTSLTSHFYSIVERNIAFIKSKSEFEKKQILTDEDGEPIDIDIDDIDENTPVEKQRPIRTGKIIKSTGSADIPIQAAKFVNDLNAAILEPQNGLKNAEILLNALKTEYKESDKQAFSLYKAGVIAAFTNAKLKKSYADAYFKAIERKDANSFTKGDLIEFLTLVSKFDKNKGTLDQYINNDELSKKISTPANEIARSIVSGFDIPNAVSKTIGGKKQYKFVRSNTIMRNLKQLESYGNNRVYSKNDVNAENVLPAWASNTNNSYSVNPYVDPTTKSDFKITEHFLVGGDEYKNANGYVNTTPWANLTTKQRHIQVLQYAWGHGKFKEDAHHIFLPQQGDATTAYVAQVPLTFNTRLALERTLMMQAKKLTKEEQIEKLGYSLKKYNFNDIVDFELMDEAVKKVTSKIKNQTFTSMTERCRFLLDPANKNLLDELEKEFEKLILKEVDKEIQFIAQNKYHFTDNFFGNDVFATQVKNAKTPEEAANILSKDVDFLRVIKKILYSHSYNGYFINQYLNGDSETYGDAAGTLKRRDSNGSPKESMRISNGTAVNTTGARVKFRAAVVKDINIFGNLEDVAEKEEKEGKELDPNLKKWTSEMLLNELGFTKESDPDLFNEWEGDYKPSDGQGIHIKRRNNEIRRNYGTETNYGRILKPLINDRYTRNGFETPFIGKYSSILLDESVAKVSPIAKQIMDWMEKHNIDELLFDSAIKCGQMDSQYQIDLNDILNDTVPQSHMDSAIVELNNDAYGLQLDPISTATKVTYPSQLFYFPRITQDLKEFKTGVNPIDMYQYMADLIDFRKSVDDRKTKFGDKYNRTVLLNKIKGQLDAKNLMGNDLLQDLLNAFVKQKKGNIAFNLPVFSEFLENAILGGRYKNVVQTKFKGKKNVLVSSVLTNNYGYKFDENTESKIPNLKTYKNDKGEIVSQAVVPKGKYITKSDGKKVWKGLIPEEVQNKMIANQKAGKDILDGVTEQFILFGFRIPSTGIHSALPLEIVGFYDDKGTNGIIVPPDVVQKHGSDFDVDSLFTIALDEFQEDFKVGDTTYRKNTVVGENGSLEDMLKEYAEKPTSELEEYITKAYQNKIASEMKKIFVHKHNAHMMTTTINMQPYKDVIERLYGKKQKITDPSTINGMLKQVEVAMAGVTGTGISASALKFLGYIYEAGENGIPKFNPKVLETISFVSNGQTKVIDQVTIDRDAVKELDGLVNLNIDNIKELGLDALNLDTNTITLFIAMRMVGLDLNQSSKIMTSKLMRYLRDNNLKVNTDMLVTFGITEEAFSDKNIKLDLDALFDPKNKKLFNTDFNWSGSEYDYSEFTDAQKELTKQLLVFLYRMSQVSNMALEVNTLIDAVAKPRTTVEQAENLIDIYNKLNDEKGTLPEDYSFIAQLEPHLQELLKEQESTTVSNTYIFDIPNFFKVNPHIKAAAKSVIAEYDFMSRNFPFYSSKIKQFIIDNPILRKVRLSEIQTDDRMLKRQELIKFVMSAFSKSKQVKPVYINKTLFSGTDAFYNMSAKRLKAAKEILKDNYFLKVINPTSKGIFKLESKLAELYNQNAIKESFDELRYLKEEIQIIPYETSIQLEKELADYNVTAELKKTLIEYAKEKGVLETVDNMNDIQEGYRILNYTFTKMDTYQENSYADIIFEQVLLDDGLTNTSQSLTRYISDDIMMKYAKNFTSLLSIMNSANVDHMLEDFTLEFMVKHKNLYTNLNLRSLEKTKTQYVYDDSKHPKALQVHSGMHSELGFYDASFPIKDKNDVRLNTAKKLIEYDGAIMKLIGQEGGTLYYRKIATLPKGENRKMSYSMNDKMISYQRLINMADELYLSANVDPEMFEIEEKLANLSDYVKEAFDTKQIDETNNYYKALKHFVQNVVGTKFSNKDTVLNVLKSDIKYTPIDIIEFAKDKPIIPVKENKTTIKIISTERPDDKTSVQLFNQLRIQSKDFTLFRDPNIQGGYLVTHLISDIGIKNPTLYEYHITELDVKGVTLELTPVNSTTDTFNFSNIDKVTDMLNGDKETTIKPSCKL